MNTINVTKRNKTTKPWDSKNVKRTIDWGVEGIEGIDPLKLEEKFSVLVYDGIPTKEIMFYLIDTAIKLISLEEPNWIKVAGRLASMDLNKTTRYNLAQLRGSKVKRKFGYGNVSAIINWFVDNGIWSKNIPNNYTQDQIDDVVSMINPEIDNTYEYPTIMAFGRQYLTTYEGKVIELPQEAYVGISLMLATPYGDNKVEMAKKFYHMISNQLISPATPIVSNMRKPGASGTSCEIVAFPDNLNGIAFTNTKIMQDTSKGTGFGAYFGLVRANGSSVRGKPGAAGGSIPYIKIVNDIISATDQLGVRDGNITITHDIWHLDVEDFIQIKDENGDQRQRAHGIFRSISTPDLFFKREEARGVWSLFDPYEIKKILGDDLANFYGEEFERKYLMLERMGEDGELKLFRQIKAKSLFLEILKRVPEAGDPMFFYRDNANKTHPNKHMGVVYGSNLCAEIVEIFAPAQDKSDIAYIKDNIYHEKLDMSWSYAATCNLASINLGKLPEDLSEIRDIVRTTVFMLDSVVSQTVNANPQAERMNNHFRPMGIGYIGYAHWLAKHKLSYGSPEAIKATETLLEKIAFHAIEASVELAELYGAYSMYEGSEWSKGIFFGKHVTDLGPSWNALYERMKKTGMRNGYLFAIAPNTSTSILMSEIASIFPAKGFIIQKDGKAGRFPAPLPELGKLQWYYKTLDRVTHEEYINTVACFQGWVDQSISMEVPINMNIHTPKDIYNFYINAWKKGLKTTYYGRPQSIDCDSCSN